MARTLRSDRTANRKDGHKDTTKRKQSKSKATDRPCCEPTASGRSVAVASYPNIPDQAQLLLRTSSELMPSQGNAQNFKQENRCKYPRQPLR